jgi:hypothetical protein
MNQREGELQENAPPQRPTADSAPQRRAWQAPRGQIVEVAVATRVNGGGLGDASNCHS